MGSGLETQTDLIPKGGLGIRPGANTGDGISHRSVNSEVLWHFANSLSLPLCTLFSRALSLSKFAFWFLLGLVAFLLMIFVLNTFFKCKSRCSQVDHARAPLGTRPTVAEGRGSSGAGIAHSVSGVLEVRVRLMSLSQMYQFSLVLWNVFLDRHHCETGFLLVDFSLKIVISQDFAAPSSSGGCSCGRHSSVVEFVSV